ncbi:MAG: T9SS type A sorting domain-containing protein, partial [Bacteroidetes bacterium]|nr:T9SS type A sorting domain-containing protein [Bacteroidota bacterium]
SSQAYSFVHSRPSAGGNFYRIVEVDQDGQSSFSKVIFVLNYNNSKGFTIYPDPVINKVLNVQSGVGGLFSIYNSMGSQVMQQQLEPGTTQINLHHLSPGIYYIRAKGKALRFVLL